MEQNVLEQILEGSMKPTHLPLETLREITDGFSVDRVIGEGGFGTVYKGVIGDENVAVKRIRSSMTINQKLFRREVDSQMDVNHENVVRFLGLCSHTVETPMKDPESQRYIYAEIRERLLCFEYVSNGSLDKYITDELRGLEWATRYQIIRGICAGLQYLHIEKRILHMDLKPANILLDNQMVPKITDFGLSRPVESPQTMTANHFSSPGYGAPENIFGHGTMSVKSDMYSLGAIMIELITGRKGIPHSKNNILRRWRHRWNKSVKETPLEYHQQVTECIEIGSLCLNSDPYARPSISQIMSKFVEMESTKINPLYLEDDMLGVEPLELQFRYSKKKQILSCSVELRNDMDGFVAFIIQTSSSLPYSIEPNMGIMKLRSKCSVYITLDAANAHDHRAALQYSTSNKQYTEEFIVRSIKVNEGLTTQDINQDMFEKHTSGHHIDEIHLVVVSGTPTIKDIDEDMLDEHVDEIDLTVLSEESCSEEVIDCRSKQSKKQYASSDGSRLHSGSTHINVNDDELTIASSNSGMQPTPIEPGSMQLVIIKKKEMAPFFEHNTKLMLELTGGDYTVARPGLDLVTVLDISSCMWGERMKELKTAMRFVIQKLGPIDRLSIVTFFDYATKLCPLRQITKASQQELQEIIDGLRVSGDYTTNIKDGLLTGLKVLADRKINSGRVGAIMLISGDQWSTCEATSVSVSNVPVYTFHFGVSDKYAVLSMVAANSMGGTFSHVQDDDTGGLTMAFSQCLAGLLTVAVQDLELTVEAIRDESKIVTVTAGSYPQTEDSSGLVTIRFGNLYSREVRKVIVDLCLPAVDSERSAEILRVAYSYSSSSSAGRLQSHYFVPGDMLTVRRTAVGISEQETPLEFQMEEDRLRTAEMMEDTATKIRHRPWFSNQDEVEVDKKKVVEAQNLKVHPLLKIELLEFLAYCQNPRTYDDDGRAYLLSSRNSHDWQRFAARGRDVQNLRLYATPRMDMYLEQAKKFYADPAMQLPSTDDDVQEELFGDPTINLASREHEMRRLSLDREG